ncbi:hypothetical protein SteCoe_17285 [Stentor coeruleus]|uniref:Uncharacterized protein n=1 Tax=Stentor coeruleus TaxID=5963 RepID=A0A1R2BZF9_9CILI|nr:hypothetical protein SteCoe_17285 [Stentor coeruleus]
MSDLLHNVYQLRESLKKKRQQRAKELSLNFAPFSSQDNNRSYTERNTRIKSNNAERSQISEIIVTSPLPLRSFDFRETITSPSRDTIKVQLRSYKIDAVHLLVSRVNRYLNKHLFIWKKNTEALRQEEINLFKQNSWRLKVNVVKQQNMPREVQSIGILSTNNSLAGKIIRQSQDSINKLVSKTSGSVDIQFDDMTPLMEKSQEKIICQSRSFVNPNFSPVDRSLKKSHSHYKSPQPKSQFKTGSLANILKKTISKILIKVFCIIKNFSPKVKKVSSPVQRQPLQFLQDLIINDESKSPSPNNTRFINSLFEEKPSHKDSIEGCFQNLKNFLSEKRIKKPRSLIFRKNSGILQISIEKLIKSLTLTIYSKVFKTIKNISSLQSQHLSNIVIKAFTTAKTRLYKSVFELIYEYPNLRKINEKTIKILFKNLNKDYIYRLGACFNFWKNSMKKSDKDKELCSLSTVSIHNIIQNIINCRTKIFFSNYKLALIKYLQINQDKFKNIIKGLNRLSICMREYKVKPFFIWKCYVANCKKYAESIKKYIFRIERNIKKLVFECFLESFVMIKLFVRQKQSAVRVITKAFIKNVKGFFDDFRIVTLRPDDLKRKFVGKYKVPKGIKKNSLFAFGNIPKRRSFKYIFHFVLRLANDLLFHHNCLKKNTLIRWKNLCNNVKRVQSIKMRYDKELNHTLSCTVIAKNLDMIMISFLRFSFIKILKY